MDTTLTVDTSPFSQIDRRFLHVLFASLLVHAMAAVWVNRQPHVVADEAYETSPIDRFAPLLPIPRVKLAPQPRPPPAPKGPQAPKPGGAPGRGPAPALPGLLAASVAELTKGHDSREALDGVRRSDVDTTLLASRRERGPNEAQAIEPVTTGGTKFIGIGEHLDGFKVKPKVDDIEIVDPPANPEVFLRYINARRTALAACYERELKYNHSLRGKVTVSLTVASDGRAREVSVDPGTLGSPAVADCIRSLVRGWTFPSRPADEVPLQFPVLFTPAQ